VAVGLLTFVAWCALFITGETPDDPGGWAGVGYVAIWMVPMLGLSALVVWRPRTAVPVLTVLTLAVAAVLILGGIRRPSPSRGHPNDSETGRVTTPEQPMDPHP